MITLFCPKNQKTSRAGGDATEFRTGRHCVFKLHVHLVFVTKYRRRVLTEAAHETLQAIFTKVCEDFDATLVESNPTHSQALRFAGTRSGSIVTVANENRQFRYNSADTVRAYPTGPLGGLASSVPNWN